MRPLQSIAMGLVVVGLSAPLGGYDALPDPLGWALVLLGARGLPQDLERRGTLIGLAALALLISIPLWVPGVSEDLFDVHPSLGWAANLPQLGFLALLSLVLGRRAADAGDRGAAAWGSTAATCFLAAAVLPVLVFGGGVDGLETPSYAVATLALLLLVWLLFAWSSRPWVTAASPESTGPGPAPLSPG